MQKIYYNKQGFVCLRYPNDFPIDDENAFIEVSNEDYEKTLSTVVNFAWKVKDGKLVNERYQPDNEKELLMVELMEIRQWFFDNDWKVNKIVVEEWTREDPRWIEYYDERQLKRQRLDQIEFQLKMLG